MLVASGLARQLVGGVDAQPALLVHQRALPMATATRGF